MSGRTAKAARRADKLAEAIAQIHDRLHRGDVEAAHELCHEAMDSGSVESDVAPLTGARMTTFDADFRQLCIRTGVRASYVAIDAANPDPERGTRLVSGGDGPLVTMTDAALREVL